MAQESAHYVPPLNSIPVYVDGRLRGHWAEGRIMPIDDFAARAFRQSRCRNREDEKAKCYFIGGDDGPVKIGQSGNLPQRLREIQYLSPVRLSVLAAVSGGLSAEMAYHARFAEHRLHGEWFERHPDILAEITRLTSSNGA